MGLRLQGLMFPWRLPCLRILQHLQLQRFLASESVARCYSKAMSMEAVQGRDPEEEEDEKLGVLIVGAGPVGLTLCILLSSSGFCASSLRADSTSSFLLQLELMIVLGT
ncbi:hypothetical protein CY35_07G052100 [Sphagnum magellanicum]|uniref:Uncharacterized protein n=1 Tax=Sphagnum magellanicum TaxID=128215 RepID=A0ACB8HM45_9BRYO|nr:hypothetical protein CY35_07G052100 [Sphagnum magellanicum]